MITIGIIGVLTAVATYTYPAYTAKSQVTAAMQIIEPYIHAAQDYYIENSAMPSDISQIGGTYTPTSKDVLRSNGITLSTISATSITISATFNTTSASRIVQGNSLILQLTNNSGTASSSGSGMYSITCSSSIPNAYLPTNCQQ